MIVQSRGFRAGQNVKFWTESTINRASFVFMRKISQALLQNILEVAAFFPSGGSTEDIMRGLVLPITKRTLQRYLILLVQEGRLTAIGKARARKYHIPPEITSSMFFLEEIAPYEKNIEKLIPLSLRAEGIQNKVRQPIQLRHPAGYNRDFLNKYRPNETYYLNEKERKHLFEIGKSPDGERPAGTYARQILNRLLIDLSWNSSRLEGNTYSLLETEQLIELGETAEGKDSKEAQMILNHKAAIEFLVDSAEQIKFDKFTILNLHALLSDNLLNNQRACGSLRSTPVSIAKSVYRPLAIPQLIDEYFDQILNTADEIKDPFEQSFFVTVQLPYLQPFLDVNKRVSRLAANIPFIRNNLCPLSFVDVPEDIYISGLLGVYELNRVELLKEVFVWAYERSSALYSATRQELGEPDLFRLRYRNLIIQIIGEIVRGCFDKKEAVALIKKYAYDAISKGYQDKFIRVIENELMSLHKGNIARFKLRPEEYDAWLRTWH